MSPLATACPGCGTAFRVGQEQLDAADGLVRCGACNAVFDAQAHAVNPVSAVGQAPERGIDEEYIEGLILGEPPEPSASPRADTPAEAPAPVEDAVPVPTVPDAIAGTSTPEPPAPVVPAVEVPRIPVALPLDRRLDANVRRRLVAWSLGIVLAALVIGLQQLWLGRERHAQNPELRPRYERLCALLGCELPPFRDLRRIRSEGLLVRPDPARPGILLIDATIVNRAPFPQAFPGIRIDFSDIQGRPVASHVFLPKEYLSPAALREGEMPQGEVLKVHIEMPDPGEHATNYELRLAGPEER